MKTCARCRSVKPLAEFAVDRRARGERSTRGGMGVSSQCKACVSNKRNPHLKTRRAESADRHASGQKRCNVCFDVKAQVSFAKRVASIDGLSFTCRQCAKDRCRAWKAEHPRAYSEWHDKNRDHKRQYWLSWRAQNVDRVKASYAQWARENTGVVRANAMARKAAKIQATPRWADLDAIKEIYKTSVDLERATGVSHAVDHIVPLRSRIVCGLHWPGNLQILTRAENLKKSNRLEASC